MHHATSRKLSLLFPLQCTIWSILRSLIVIAGGGRKKKSRRYQKRKRRGLLWLPELRRGEAGRGGGQEGVEIGNRRTALHPLSSVKAPEKPPDDCGCCSSSLLREIRLKAPLNETERFFPSHSEAGITAIRQANRCEADDRRDYIKAGEK